MLRPMDFTHFLKTIGSGALQAVVGHWHEARGSMPITPWENLNPARIAPHLSILWVYRFDPAQEQFVGRLAGDRIAWGLGKNFRGTPMRELWPSPVYELSHRIMMRVMSEPVIYRNAGGLFKHGGRIIAGERIILPLGGDGARGDGVLGASVYHHPLRTLEHGPVELISEDAEWFSIS